MKKTTDPLSRSTDRIVIVTSKTDPASENMAKQLIREHGFTRKEGSEVYQQGNVRLALIEEHCIHARLDQVPADTSSIIFASKHVSATNTPAMTVHSTGNLSKRADFGGRPEEVSFSDPSMVRTGLRELTKRVAAKGLNIDVTMEATHHGPTSFPVPVCFVEIGSGSQEWNDPLLGDIAAGSIMAVATSVQDNDPVAVGFGGTHYAAKHTRICLDGGYQVGHVIPKHAFQQGLSESVIRDTFRKTVGTSSTALLDWKGLRSQDRQELAALLEQWMIDVVRV